MGAGHPSTPADRSVTGIWPLIGRTEELRLINAAVTGANGYGGIVIAGSAGVGKSRLAQESIHLIRSGRWVSRWVRATASARALPLGAFAEWTGDIAGAPMLVVRNVISHLTAAAPGTKVVIGVDDAHLLDDLSAFVVLQLVQRRLAKVVVTIRTGEPCPDAVNALWKERYLQRLELQPLSLVETETLLREVLGGSVESELAARMWKLTRGNVLYLRHVLERELTDGRIRERSGLWRWAGHPVVSETLAELIEQQIGRLPAPIGDVVDVVSLSEPLETTTLCRVTDREAAEEAEKRGLIVISDSEGTLSARLAHPLYGEVRRARWGPLRLQRLSGEIAVALTATPEVDSRDTVRRAALWLNSDLVANPDLYSRAAAAAMTLSDFPLAERLANESIAAGAGIELIMIRAHALAVLNRAEEAEEVLAAAPSTPALPNADLSRLVTLRAIILLFPLGRPQESANVVTTALHDLEPSKLQNLAPIRCLHLAMSAQPGPAITTMASVDRTILPGLPAMMATWGLIIALGDCGRVAEAVRIAEAGYKLAAHAPEVTYQTIALAEFHVVTLLLAGYVHEAMGAAERTFRECSDLHGRMHSMSTAIMGMAVLGTGRAARATKYLREGLADEYEESDSTGYWYRYSLVLIHALALSGNGPAATEVLQAATSRRHPSFTFVESERLLAAAWVAAAEGAISTAIDTARQAADFAAQHDQFQREVVCLDTATRFGDPTTAERLQVLADWVEGPRATAAARHASALATRDPVGLSDASDRFEEMGDLLAAMDAAAHAATVYRRRGCNGSALTATARAQRLAEACGGADTPALREAQQPSPLTGRQREVITLAAQGLSNKQIAEKMTLSVRTVEGHLHRAAQRTGVSGRGDLGAIITGDQPPPDRGHELE
ncbi:LuxR C-terminal-related transcriptional regulator [Rhodococcus sp. NCIMB 12038]|uniref:LuxR C-terminal-related transcriptional regulator n=1 Tax=Rhodococcus sp. NCIMB 12038 TaxID=933800 RepID=UPI000B3CD907|nr:hypothetical protein CA951_13375 [Rhodococcus sp. NCIMB 12038]